MGVKNFAKKIADKAGNKIAKLSELSTEQVLQVELARENYLLEEPDPTDENAIELTQRMMAASSIEIFNAYLPQIKDLYLPINKDAEYDLPFNADNNIRYINITKWVTDRKENNLEKLVNVYAVLSNEDCNIALVFNRTQKTTNVYLAVVNNLNAGNNTDANNYRDRLIDAIRGNFPGAEFSESGMGVIPCMKNDRVYSVASASNIPTEKSEKFVSQTIEKLLDGIVPDSKQKEYTIVLLATPIKDVEERKLKLGEFYSGLAPYSAWQTDFHYMENESRGSSATVGINVGASVGVQNGTNSSITETNSETDSESVTNTESQSDTETDSASIAESESSSHMDGTNSSETSTLGQNYMEQNSISETKGTSGSVALSEKGKAGFLGTGVEVGATETVGTNASTAIGSSTSNGWNSSIANQVGKSAADTLTKGITQTIGKSVAKTTGTAVANTLGKAVTKAMAATSGVSRSVSQGLNFGGSFARSSTVTAMIGKNEGITQSFTNFNIKHALELLENQMKRLEQSSALGMWDFAAYVLSEDQNVANNVAHSYLALTLGEDSYMSKSAVNLWRGTFEEERDITKTISDYLRELRHPLFGLNPDVIDYDEEFNEYPSVVTATTSLSGKELAYSLNFPQKSIAGLPILECAEFGRTVVTYDDLNKDDKLLELGNIFHMHHLEKNKVTLSVDSLASHTFITGSTGSGKSNTIYQLINKSRKQGIKFLIVEPAKGEYKHVFGNDKDVSVYGTNPNLTPLLRINPFSFDEKIHILEHLDRLIEIFNVCWPMYAAMPAVLKNAVEKSYEDCGWDLLRSVNKYGEKIYPTFNDISRNVKSIIETSEYDSENKGAYKGSLLTRLQSLTNGINGLVFSINEIPVADLFDQNVIVDLSRVGSSETKSLIMGILVLKLQEYRMSKVEEVNSNLKHITVLEEAHNLLRRTSVEQSADNSNLLGKSVEMLANAIAEMRTYGEGFVIADQAPGLMDMSVIRNTNTKIIMRLPDQSDRELVGRAASLNEDQITELAKLPCGVAAVYQNEWVQPVLCKIGKYDNDNNTYHYDSSTLDVSLDDNQIKESLLDCIMDKELQKKGNKAYVRRIKKKILESRLDASVKCDFMKYLQSDSSNNMESLRVLLYNILSAQNAIYAAKDCESLNEWVHTVVEKLDPSIKQYSNKQIDLAMALILYEHKNNDASYNDLFCNFTEAYTRDGGVY